MRWLGFVDILVLWRGSAPHPRKSSRGGNLIASNFLYARDDLRHSPRRGEEALLPLPFRERVGVRVGVRVKKEGSQQSQMASSDWRPVPNDKLGEEKWLLQLTRVHHG